MDSACPDPQFLHNGIRNPSGVQVAADLNRMQKTRHASMVIAWDALLGVDPAVGTLDFFDAHSYALAIK